MRRRQERRDDERKRRLLERVEAPVRERRRRRPQRRVQRQRDQQQRAPFAAQMVEHVAHRAACRVVAEFAPRGVAIRQGRTMHGCRKVLFR